MYNPKEVFEKLKCRECRNLVGCGYTNRIKCYNKYLEELTKLMLEALKFEYNTMCQGCKSKLLCREPCYHRANMEELIEQVTQKKIEELKEYNDVCIDDLIGGNG